MGCGGGSEYFDHDLTRFNLLNNLNSMKHLNVHDEDHTTIKSLAAKIGKSIQDFMKDLIKAYNKQTKG